MSVRRNLRRWHIWLGWIVGIPFLFWVVSGLVMVVRPIEEVRGTDLLREPQPVQLRSAPVPPRIEGVPLRSLTLEQRASGPRWVATLPDGTKRSADPGTGVWLPEVAAVGAAAEVTARYTGSAGVARVTRTDPDSPPLALRRKIPA
ncbi:MAG: PepSY domain-containing protein, partial [Pseudomonadota bacterium]|nr:PepSY domain-containing protein [Pseudomonadota bacterium]